MKVKLLVASISIVCILAIAPLTANSLLVGAQPPPENICAPQDGDWTPYVHVLGRSFPRDWYYHAGDRVTVHHPNGDGHFLCVWWRWNYDVTWIYDPLYRPL